MGQGVGTRLARQGVGTRLMLQGVGEMGSVWVCVLGEGRGNKAVLSQPVRMEHPV